MIEIKDKLEHSLAIFKSDQFFISCLEQTVEQLRKLYQISNMDPFHCLIKNMVKCLIIDYYISIFQPQRDQIRLLGELYLHKSSLIQKIKEDQSILTIQGKMKEHSKSDNIYIVSTKIAHYQLIKTKSAIGEDQLFKRLNFILNGTKISNKCYKLSLNRLAQNFPKIQKQSKFHETRYTLNEKQNALFKQVFFSMNDLVQQDSVKKPKPMISSVNNNSEKIKNIINKVRLTINRQSKKFQKFQQKKERVAKIQKNQSNMQQQLLQNRLRLKLHKHPSRKSSMASISRNKNSSRLKRVGTFQSEGAKSKLLLLNELPSYNLQDTSNQSSDESVPDSNDNWYKSESKQRTKRVFTLYLPTINNKAR